MGDNHTGLNDPEYARFAWQRYRRILKWMALVSLLVALASLAYVHWSRDGLTWPMGIATFLGVGLTVFIAAALMGLVFLSSGTGHDEDADRTSRNVWDPDMD